MGIVEDSTSNLGDRFIIRKSFNNGLSWTRQNTFSATTIQIFSPSFCIAPSTGNIFVVCSASQGNETSLLIGREYSYDALFLVQNIDLEFEYPGAGLIRSSFVVANTTSDEVWLFVEDQNDWLYLSRSSDLSTWTPFEPVAVNVSRPSGEVCAEGNVAVTWSQSITGDIMCAVGSIDGSFQPAVTVTTNASTMATPIPAWEHLGEYNLGVIWHSDTGKSYLNLSSDGGETWGEDLFVVNGYYPYIDHFAGTRRMGACAVNEAGDVLVANASNLSALPMAPFTVRSGHQATIDEPAKVAFGQSSYQLALFYLTPTTEDFWFNSSVLTGIEEGEGHSVSPSVTAGPNPSAGSFSVSAAGFFGNAVYGVYSLDGRLITSSTSDTGGVTINGSQLPAGLHHRGYR